MGGRNAVPRLEFLDLTGTAVTSDGLVEFARRRARAVPYPATNLTIRIREQIILHEAEEEILALGVIDLLLT